MPTLILLSYWRPKPNGARQELDVDKRGQKFAYFRIARQSLLPTSHLHTDPQPPSLLRLSALSFGACTRASPRRHSWQAPLPSPISGSAPRARKTLSPKVAAPYFRTHVAGHFCDYHLPLPSNCKLPQGRSGRERDWGGTASSIDELLFLALFSCYFCLLLRCFHVKEATFQLATL